MMDILDKVNKAPIKFLSVLLSKEYNSSENEIKKNSVILIILLERVINNYISNNIKKVRGVYFKKSFGIFTVEMDLVSMGKKGSRYLVSDLNRDNPNKIFNVNPTEIKKDVDCSLLLEIQDVLNENESRISYGNQLTMSPFGGYLLEMTYREEDGYLAVESLRGVVAYKRPDHLLRQYHNSFEVDMGELYTEIERRLLMLDKPIVYIKNTVVKL